MSLDAESNSALVCVRLAWRRLALQSKRPLAQQRLSSRPVQAFWRRRSRHAISGPGTVPESGEPERAAGPGLGVC